MQFQKLPIDVQLHMLQKLPAKDILRWCSQDKKHQEMCWEKKGVEFLLKTPSVQYLTLDQISKLSSDPGWQILKRIYGPKTQLYHVTESVFYGFRKLMEAKDQDDALLRYIGQSLYEANALPWRLKKPFSTVSPDEWAQTFETLKKHYAVHPDYDNYDDTDSYRDEDYKTQMELAQNFLLPYQKLTTKSLLRNKGQESHLKKRITDYL